MEEENRMEQQKNEERKQKLYHSKYVMIIDFFKIEIP